MKERRKRNMSRTGLLFMFCLLMLCGCAQITGFMENTEVSGREVESLAAEKEEDTADVQDAEPEVTEPEEQKAEPEVAESEETEWVSTEVEPTLVDEEPAPIEIEELATKQAESGVKILGRIYR